MRRSSRFTRLPLLFAPIALLAACEISAGDEEPAEGTRQMMTPTDVDAAIAQVRPQYIHPPRHGCSAPRHEGDVDARVLQQRGNRALRLERHGRLVVRRDDRRQRSVDVEHDHEWCAREARARI